MKPFIECPNGEFRSGTRIFCKVAQDWCGNQYFRRCRGWWANTVTAKDCPIRKESQKHA